MKVLVYLVLGLVALAAVAFAAFWIWGTLAFTPERIPVAIETQGAFEDGVIYTIERTSRGLQTSSRCVNFGRSETGANLCALYVEGPRPRPIAVRRIGADAAEVDFDARDRLAPVRIPLDADGAPTEVVTVSADGAVSRAPAPWLPAPGEAPL